MIELRFTMEVSVVVVNDSNWLKLGNLEEREADRANCEWIRGRYR